MTMLDVQSPEILSSLEQALQVIDQALITVSQRELIGAGEYGDVLLDVRGLLTGMKAE